MKGMVEINTGAGVDAPTASVYDGRASGRLDDRGRLRKQGIEESPYSTGRDAGEIPGWSDLSVRATETDSHASGDGEKAA